MAILSPSSPPRLSLHAALATAPFSSHHATIVLTRIPLAFPCSRQGFAPTGNGSLQRFEMFGCVCSHDFALSCLWHEQRKRKTCKSLQVCLFWRIPYAPGCLDDSKQMLVSMEQGQNADALRRTGKVEAQKNLTESICWKILCSLVCFSAKIRVSDLAAYGKEFSKTFVMTVVIIVGFGVTASLACEQRVQRDASLAPFCQMSSLHSLQMRSNRNERASNLEDAKVKPLPQQDEDAESKEAERAFEEWKSTPYALTVPLKIVGLRGSVPPIWLKDFILAQGRRVKLAAQFEGSLNTIFTELSSAFQKKQITSRSPMAADLVTIGDSWLGPAIALGLVKPIEDADQSHWFRILGCKWQAFLRRDEKGHVSSTGKVWGVPYRCGCLVIAYKKEKLLKLGVPPIKDWVDLWRPELSGKISMVDSPREVVGAVLKSLGASYNTSDFQKVPGGKTRLRQQFCEFRKQIRMFDSVNYLKALGTGDVYVAVGWSADVIPFAKRTSNIAIVAPESGTSLWVDLWAVPAATSIKSEKIGGRIRGPSPLISQWFEFCLQPARALSFEQGAFAGASPLNLYSSALRLSVPEELYQGSMNIDSQVTSNPPSDPYRILEDVPRDTAGRCITPQLDTNTIGGLPPSEIISKSEFLQPLNEEAIANYEWLFT